MRASTITASQLRYHEFGLVLTAIIVMMFAVVRQVCGSVIVFGRTIMAITTGRGEFHALFAIRSHAANERDRRHQRHALSENRQ